MMRHALSTLDADLSLRERLAEAEHRIDTLEAERHDLNWRLLAAEQELARQRRQPRLERHIDDLELCTQREVADNLRRENQALRASTSWRVTAPMRALSGLLRPHRG